MADISEELLKKIWDTFEKELANNNKMKAILKKVEDGSATYIEANDYSYYAGEAIAKAIKKNISEDDLPDGIMSKDIAEKILRPMFSKDYDLVSDVCLQVQEALNESAGIGIKAIKPSFPNDRMMGIADYVSQKKYREREKSLSDNVVNAIQSISEDSVKKNAEFQYRSGLTPMIVRTLKGKACDFCEKRAGKYEYPLKDNEIYRRHPNCRCTVEFVPAGSKKRQNVHTKQWESDDKKTQNEAKEFEKNTLINDDKRVMINEYTEDVTKKYLDSAKPGIGTVLIEQDSKQDDIDTASWIVKTFGGEVKLLKEAHVKMPDSFWKGAYWEYKAPSSETSVDDRLRTAHNQLYDAITRNNAVGGRQGIVIDINKSKLDQNRIIECIIEKNIKRKKVDVDIIIRNGNELIKVIRQ